MVLVVLIMAGALGFIVFVTIRSIMNERDRRRSVWREYGLSLSLMLLFAASWIGHAMSQWQAFTDEQNEHGQPVTFGDFMADFSRATLENWQSEFLQLFAFVTLAALYIHKGSAESKDSDEKMEASLRRIEEKLGTLPDSAPKSKGESWKLPDTPMQVA